MRISDWSSDVCSSDLIDRFPVPADFKVQLGFRHISAGARQPNYLAFLHLLPPHHVKRVRMSIGSHPPAAMGDEHQAAEQFYFIACISDYAICCGEDRRTLGGRSEEHTTELQSLMRISYAVLCLKKKTRTQ